jgi:hypothetical protein
VRTYANIRASDGREEESSYPRINDFGQIRSTVPHPIPSIDKISIHIEVGHLPFRFGAYLVLNRGEISGEVRRVWIGILGKNVIDLMVYRGQFKRQRSWRRVPTSKLPAKGPKILSLQKLVAAAQVKFEPPLLHAVICSGVHVSMGAIARFRQDVT